LLVVLGVVELEERGHLAAVAVVLVVLGLEQLSLLLREPHTLLL
jgi:hypothetical protein